METVKIENSKFVRDIQSKAILSTDKNGLNEYYMKRELAKKELKDKFETKDRLEKLESDMQDIKSLLIKIAEMQK